MEGFGFILFLIAIVVSLFDQSRKGKGKGTGTPGGPPTRPRPTDLPRPTRQLPQQRSSGKEEEQEGSASEMVAEDFWAELTGQRRRAPEPVPTPKPKPTPPRKPTPMRTPVEDLPSWDEEAVAAVDERPREAVRAQPQALDAYRRQEVVHEPPRIVSLETPLLPPEQRHAAFHRRLEATRPTATELAPPRERPNPLRDRLRSRETLRDSFILQEVFGTPKGLEE